jgi:hypothetical protein
MKAKETTTRIRRALAAIKANLSFHDRAMCPIACATKSAKAKSTSLTTSNREANESQRDYDAESDEPRLQLKPILVSTTGPRPIACATKSAKAKRTSLTTSNREANESQGNYDAESDEPWLQLKPILVSTTGPRWRLPGNPSGHAPPRVRGPKERA